MRHAGIVAAIVIALALAGASPSFCGTIVLNTANDPPNATDEHTGICDRIMAEASKRLGLALEIVNLPSERALINANEGLDDGNFARVEGLEKQYPNLIRVAEEITTFEFVAFSAGAALETRGWESLKPHNVGIITGWKILESNITGAASLAVKVRELLGGTTAAAQPGKSVLMIDDDEQFRELVGHFCTKLGHGFAGVDSAAAAIAALAQQSFDVLLVDLSIPGTSGERVLREIRAAGCAASAIMLTGDVASADMDALRPLGVVQALEKSSNAEPLLQAIVTAGAPDEPRERDGRELNPDEPPRV